MAGGLAASIPAAYYLQHRSIYYRNLQPSLKVLGVVLVAVPACVISAEKAGIAYEREQWYAEPLYPSRFFWLMLKEYLGRMWGRWNWMLDNFVRRPSGIISHLAKGLATS